MLIPSSIKYLTICMYISKKNFIYFYVFLLPSILTPTVVEGLSWASDSYHSYCLI